MYKTNLHTILKEKDKKKFQSLSKKKNLIKRDLFTEAFNYFKVHIVKSKNYQLKYQEIDKIADEQFTIFIFDETYSEIKEIGKKLNISVNGLAREIICVYNEND